MKKHILLGLAAVSYMFAASPALAEIKIAVVDIQRVLAVSSAAKSLAKEREDLRKSVGSEIANKE